MSAIVLSALNTFPVDAITKQVDSVKVKETGYGSRRKVVFEFKDCVVPMVNNPGNGGQICNKLFDLPAELIEFEAMRVNLTIARASGTVGGLADAFAGDIGIGSTTGIGPALATTEQDIYAQQAIGPAAAGVATVKQVQNPTAVPFDATAGVSGFLNILVAAANEDGTAVTVKLNGTITMFYTVLGA